MNAPFTFPQKAFLGRNIPKNRIYEHASPTKALKELFVREVDRITWSYKLSPETLNLPPKPESGDTGLHCCVETRFP